MVYRMVPSTIPLVLVFDENGCEISVDSDALAACLSAAELKDVVSRTTLQRRLRCFHVLQLSPVEEMRCVQRSAALPHRKRTEMPAPLPTAGSTSLSPPPACPSTAGMDAVHARLADEVRVDYDADCTLAQATFTEVSSVSHCDASTTPRIPSVSPPLERESCEDVAAATAEGASGVWRCAPLSNVPLFALQPLREWPPSTSQAPLPSSVSGAQGPTPHAPPPSLAAPVPATDVDPCAGRCAPRERDSDAAAHLPAGAVVLYALTSAVLLVESEVPAVDAAPRPASVQPTAGGGPRHLDDPPRPTPAAKETTLTAAITNATKDPAMPLAVPLALASSVESASISLPLSRSLTVASDVRVAATAAATAAPTASLGSAAPRRLPHVTFIDQPDLSVVRMRAPFPERVGALVEVSCAYGGSRFARGCGGHSSIAHCSAASVVSSAVPGLTASSVNGSTELSPQLSGGLDTASLTTTSPRGSSLTSSRVFRGRKLPPLPLAPRCAATVISPVISAASHRDESSPALSTGAAAARGVDKSRSRRAAPAVCRNPVPPLSKSTISLAIALHINCNYATIHCLLRHYVAFEVELIVEALQREHPFLHSPAAHAFVMSGAELQADAEGQDGDGGGAGDGWRPALDSSDQLPDAEGAATSEGATAAQADVLTAQQAQRRFTLCRRYFAYVRWRISSGQVNLSQAIFNVGAATRQMAATGDNSFRGAPPTAAIATTGLDAVVDVATPEVLREVRRWLVMTPQTGEIKSMLERHLSSEDRLRCEQIQRLRSVVTARTSTRATAELRAAQIASVLRAACDDEQLAADALVHLVKDRCEEAPAQEAARQGATTTTTAWDNAGSAVADDQGAELAAALATVEQRNREVEWFSGIEHAVALRLIQPSRLLDLVECIRCNPNAVVELWYNSDARGLDTLRQTVQWLKKRLNP